MQIIDSVCEWILVCAGLWAYQGEREHLSFSPHRPPFEPNYLILMSSLLQRVIAISVVSGASLWFSFTVCLCRWILSTLCSELQVCPSSETNRSSRWIRFCACLRTSFRGWTYSPTSSASPLTPTSHHTHSHTHTAALPNTFQPHPDYHGWMLGADRGPPHVLVLAQVYTHILEAGFGLHSLRTNTVTQFWLDSSEPFCL